MFTGTPDEVPKDPSKLEKDPGFTADRDQMEALLIALLLEADQSFAKLKKPDLSDIYKLGDFVRKDNGYGSSEDFAAYTLGLFLGAAKVRAFRSPWRIRLMHILILVHRHGQGVGADDGRVKASREMQIRVREAVNGDHTEYWFSRVFGDEYIPLDDLHGEDKAA